MIIRTIAASVLAIGLFSSLALASNGSDTFCSSNNGHRADYAECSANGR
jgi:hypothetical protein